MRNEKAELMVLPFFLFFLFALLITSISMAYFLTNINGSTDIKAIPFVMENYQYTGSQDFSSCSFNDSTWIKTTSGGWTTECGVGKVLTGPYVGLVNSYLLLKGEVADSNGVYTNTYYINNTPLKPYTIVLRYTDNVAQNEILVDSTGFHIPNYVIPGWIIPTPITMGTPVSIGTLFDYDYPNADQIQYATIQTVYEPTEPRVTFIFNGDTLFSTTELKSSQLVFAILTSPNYGGVGSYGQDFTLTKYETNNQINANSQNSATMVWDFVSQIYNVLSWKIPVEYDPLGITTMIISIEEIGLFICIIFIIVGLL
jgi:hypothetical protein